MAMCYTTTGKVWHHDVTNGRGGMTLCGKQVQGYGGNMSFLSKDVTCKTCNRKLNGPKGKKIRRNREV